MKGRLNKDIELGIRIGMLRAAMLVEKKSEAKENSTFAQLIRENANHESMKARQMQSEGKLI